MTIEIQVRDSEGEVHRVHCDDFSFFIDTCNLHLYNGQGQQKELVGAYRNVVYWKVVKPEPKEQ